MSMNRSISRVLAAAVASAGFAVPGPSIGATLSCTSASFSASSDGNGNITVNCTQSGGTVSPPPTSPPPPTTPPPPPGGTISCAGFSATHVIDIAWGAPASAAPRVLTSSNGGFGNNQIVVARFTTPATTAAGVFAVIKSAEWGDQQHLRSASLSQTPCDFSNPNPLGRLATTTVGTPSPSVNYAVGGTSPYYAILLPSTTYYFNIKNEAQGVSTCAPGESCNMFIELQKPKGL